MSIRAKVYGTEREARDAIAIEDAYRGYPRTEPGTRRGGGIFADSITTTSAADLIEVVGGFAVPLEALTAPEIDKADAVDVERLDPERVEEPAPIVPALRIR